MNESDSIVQLWGPDQDRMWNSWELIELKNYKLYFTADVRQFSQCKSRETSKKEHFMTQPCSICQEFTVTRHTLLANCQRRNTMVASNLGASGQDKGPGGFNMSHSKLGEYKLFDFG